MAKAKANTNPFMNFAVQTKKAKIKALGDYEITYRELSDYESEMFRQRMITGVDPETGQPLFDFSQAISVKYGKVAAMLIDPAMTEEQLKELHGIDEVLNEILELNGDKDDLLDEEGN